MAPIDVQELNDKWPTLCDPTLSFRRDDLIRGISSLGDVFAGVTAFEATPLIPCTVIFLPVLVGLLIVTLCCCAFCRRRHAYIKLEDNLATAHSPIREPARQAAASQPMPWIMPSVPRLDSASAATAPAPTVLAVSNSKRDSHREKQTHSGHLSVKPALPLFDPLLDAKERVVGYRTFILPLPSLRTLRGRVKGAVAEGLDGLKRSVTPRKADLPRMPGSNAYPYAASMFKLDGAPEPDEPDSARSGGSTFRQNSARWRAAYDRELIDDSDHLERIKSTRGRTPTKGGAKKQKPPGSTTAGSASGGNLLMNRDNAPASVSSQSKSIVNRGTV